jgi:hypothetical protein
MKKRYFAQNEELEESRNVIPVTALTKKKAMALLDGYTRVQGLFGVQGAGCRALKNLQHVKDLFVLIKKENRYFSLKGITVEDLLMKTEESGESLCKVLIYDLFGLSESQYRTIRKEFAAKDGEYGIFVKDQGQFGIFVNIPGQEAWYNDRRVQKAILSTGVVGAGVSLGSYFAGKRVGAQKPRAHEERTQEVDRDVFTFVTNNGDATTVLTTRKPTPLTPEERQQVMEEVALQLGSGGRTVDDLAEEVWDEVAEENLALRSVYDDDASYF